MSKDSKRVCYCQSIPEWFSYAVLKLFYRKTDWLFVPVQDLSPQERIKEYQKATYFVISGYGQKDEAIEAYKNGCILIGPRADVPLIIPILETKAWDPIEVLLLLITLNKLKKIRFFKNVFFNRFVFLLLKTPFYFKMGIETIRKEDLKSLWVKFLKFKKNIK